MALRRIRQVFDPSLRSDLLSASALGFIGDVVCQILIEKRPAPKEIEDLKWGHEEGKFDVRRLWALTLFSSAYIGGFLHFLYQFYSPAVFAMSKYMPLALRLQLRREDTMAHCFACACAKTLAQDPHLRYSAVGASAGAAIVGAGGAATGLTTGSLLGAAVVFTFGLSIPFCAAVGGGAGLAVGAASGATAGALAGGATGYQAYNHRHEIRASANKTLEQVTTSADFVKARANAATSFLSERATVARARLMGGGTGGTEAHD